LDIQIREGEGKKNQGLLKGSRRSSQGGGGGQFTGGAAEQRNYSQTLQMRCTANTSRVVFRRTATGDPR